MEPIVRVAAPSILEQIESFKVVTIVAILACCCVSNLAFLLWRRQKYQTSTNEIQTYDLCMQEGTFVHIPSELMDTKDTNKMKARIGSYSTLHNTIEAIEIGQCLTTQLDELSEDTAEPGAYDEDRVDMQIVEISEKLKNSSDETVNTESDNDESDSDEPLRNI